MRVSGAQRTTSVARTATDGDVEQQEITPSFIVGEVIQVTYFEDTDRWEFAGDGRMWAKTG